MTWKLDFPKYKFSGNSTDKHANNNMVDMTCEIFSNFLEFLPDTLDRLIVKCEDNKATLNEIFIENLIEEISYSSQELSNFYIQVLTVHQVGDDLKLETCEKIDEVLSLLKDWTKILFFSAILFWNFLKN